MTAIPILGGDFEILLDDEKNQNGGANAVAGMRSIQHVGTPTPVTTNVLYSAVAEAMDDFIAMGFTNAMLPTTPNAYTMENFYFIPRSTTEFLSEGAITASWGISILPDTNGNGVVKVAYTGGTNFISTDIGRQVVETSSTGTLLDFDIDPDGTLIAWIRPDDSTPTTGDVFDEGGSLTVVADSGTGASTSSTTGISGDTEWAAIQAIGSVPTASEVYLYQDRIKIASSDGTFQWWTTDTTVSLGIISILIQTQSAGVLIADGDVEVFARRYTSLYDNFRLNVSAGGFSALPLASAPDINNTTGYSTLTVIDSSGTGTFVVGEVMNEATSLASGVITAVAGTGANPIIDYYLVGDVDVDFFSGGAETVTAPGSGATLLSLAPTATVGGPTEAGAGNGGSVTIAIGDFDVDHDGDGNVEPYSVQVNAQGDVIIADVYEVIKYRTRRGADATDLFGAGVNIPGESYRGLDALIEYDNPSGTLVEGDDVVTTTGGNTWTARLIRQNTTGASLTPAYVTYITVSDQQTSVDALVNNDEIQDEALDTDLVTVHTAGTIGIENFTSPKSSPLGTFTGTQIFGARGVHFLNPAGTDTQAYILTDDRGTLNNPPNTITFTVENSAALDRILVARDTGVAGIINKNQFGGLASAAAGGTVLTVTGTIDSEVPASGFVRIVEVALRQEHHYVYDSRVTGASGTFTLRTAAQSYAGTADATTSSVLLEDAASTFQTDLIEPGMLISVTGGTGAGEFYEVVSVDGETTLTIVQIFGTGGVFAISGVYTINKFIQLYDTNDELYDLILDIEATGTSESNEFIKLTAADFTVVVNVRQGKIILPFTQNQLQQDGSVTVTVVRQPDTIAT